MSNRFREVITCTEAAHLGGLCVYSVVRTLGLVAGVRLCSGSGCTGGQVGDGIVYHLRYLPTCRVVTWPEVLPRTWLSSRSAVVPTQHLVAVRRLDVCVEGAAAGYVIECRCNRVDQ